MTHNPFEPLFRTICADWGFSLTADEAERIEVTPDLNGEKFATLVLAFESTADPDGAWKARLSACFDEHFGSRS